MIALIVLIYIWTYISLTLHEFGHFFAAKYVGMGLRAVLVGTGPLLFRKERNGIKYEFRMFPREGLTQIKQRTLKGFKKQQLVFSSAGLAVDLFLTCIFVLLIYFVPREKLYFTQLKDVLIILVAVEVYIIAVNLFPRRVKLKNAGQVDSDGKRILNVLRLDQRKFEDAVNESFMGFIQKYTPITRNDLNRVVTDDNQTFIDILFQADLAFSGGRYDEAVGLLEAIVEGTALTFAEKAFVYDFLLSALIIYGQKPYLNRSINWLDRAQALLPDCKTLMCSRGVLLIESGRFEEGRTMLLPFLEPEANEVDRLLTAAYLAKAEWSLGNIERANEHLVVAERAPAFKRITDRIRAECELQPSVVCS